MAEDDKKDLAEQRKNDRLALRRIAKDVCEEEARHKGGLSRESITEKTPDQLTDKECATIYAARKSMEERKVIGPTDPWEPEYVSVVSESIDPTFPFCMENEMKAWHERKDKVNQKASQLDNTERALRKACGFGDNEPFSRLQDLNSARPQSPEIDRLNKQVTSHERQYKKLGQALTAFESRLEDAPVRGDARKIWEKIVELAGTRAYQEAIRLGRQLVENKNPAPNINLPIESNEPGPPKSALPDPYVEPAPWDKIANQEIRLRNRNFMRMLDFLWSLSRKTCNREDIAEEIYGDEDTHCTDDQISSLRRDANSFFIKKKIPWAVSYLKKGEGTISLYQPSEMNRP